VHALRVDHVDGLRDPLAYLRRLRAALDARAPGGGHVPVFVEKILVGEERLRAGWPVDGTTGYEGAQRGGGRLRPRARRAVAGAVPPQAARRAGRGGAVQEVAVRGKEYVLRARSARRSAAPCGRS
jgi:maltooligosyltrehalose synthase